MIAADCRQEVHQNKHVYDLNMESSQEGDCNGD
jgi:hypothetical protein